jgi:hypothetical protein
VRNGEVGEAYKMSSTISTAKQSEKLPFVVHINSQAQFNIKLSSSIPREKNVP